MAEHPRALRLAPDPGGADDPIMIDTDWLTLTSAYLDTLRAAHRSPGTLRLHRHYLRHLAGFVRHPTRATPPQLVRALAVESWSAETRKSARSVTVSFYRWATAAGHIETDPSAALPKVSVPPGVPRPAPERVLAVALSGAHPRERLMLLLAAHAGLRCAEIATVHRADWTAGLLYIHGKGGKTRVIPVEHPELVAALDSATGWLFGGNTAGHLSPATVSALLVDALPDGWTGHTLRHRFATLAYDGTRDLLAVGRALGHSRPETTQRYVLLPPDALLAVVRAAA